MIDKLLSQLKELSLRVSSGAFDQHHDVYIRISKANPDRKRQRVELDLNIFIYAEQLDTAINHSINIERHLDHLSFSSWSVDYLEDGSYLLDAQAVYTKVL